MLSKLQPATGRLLISEPFLADPNFTRSVILLAEDTESGVLGVVLNQKSKLLLADLIPAMEGRAFPVFIGGPVEMNSIFFIHRCYDKLQSGFEIAEGMFWSNDFETLQDLIANDGISSDEVKFFIGYSGWSPEQLDMEISQNTWIVSDQYRPDTVFSDSEEELWREVIINLGPKYAHIINFPQDPNLN